MIAGKNSLTGSWVTEGARLHLSALPPAGAAAAGTAAPVQQGTYPYRLDANRLRLARDSVGAPIWTLEVAAARLSASPRARPCGRVRNLIR